MSRKKAKGKARKAAKAKAEAVEESAASFSLAWLKKSPCKHGWNHDEYDDRHDCCKFVEDIFELFYEKKRVFYEKKRERIHFGTVCDAALDKEKYPEIMNDPAKLQWISSLFVSIGTESL